MCSLYILDITFILPESTSVKKNNCRSGAVFDSVAQNQGRSDPTNSTGTVAEAWVLISSS